MASFKKNDNFDFVSEVRKAIQSAVGSIVVSNKGIVDILTFVEEYTSLSMENHPYMPLILKMFYYGTLGNHKLQITDEDIELIKKINNYDFCDRSGYDGLWGGNPWLKDKIEFMKSESFRPYRFLGLVLGRRSGKTIMASIMIAYEVYKLLAMITCAKCKDIVDVPTGAQCPRCGTICLNNPQVYYGVPNGEPLRIVLAATSKAQAVDPGLVYFKQRIQECNFFDDRFDWQEEQIFFETEWDKINNFKIKKMGQNELRGSIHVKAAASNAGALYGQGYLFVLLDEFAMFNTEGIDTDKALLNSIVPGTLKYRKRNDGRILMISQPYRKEGKFYETYVDNKSSNKILMFQMPTWEYAAKEYNQEDCMEEFTSDANTSQDDSFERLYGAQFVDAGENEYIPELYIDMAWKNNHLVIMDKPVNPRQLYVMHIDCAGTGSSNYAYVIGHAESRLNIDTQKYERIYIQDSSYFWRSSTKYNGKYEGRNGEIVDINKIMDEIILAAKSFRIKTISHDMMQSNESISRLSKAGIRGVLLSFSGQKQNEYYGELREAFYNQRIQLCENDRELIAELKNLRIEYGENNRQRVKASQHGLVRTKDLADCLAGSAFRAFGASGVSLAKPMAVYAPPGMGVNRAGLAKISSAGQSIFGRMNNITPYMGQK